MLACDTKESQSVKDGPTVILKFRYAPERAEMLQLIANSDHDGNLSELLRDMADERIANRLRRRSTP